MLEDEDKTEEKEEEEEEIVLGLLEVEDWIR